MTGVRQNLTPGAGVGTPQYVNNPGWSCLVGTGLIPVCRSTAPHTAPTAACAAPKAGLFPIVDLLAARRRIHAAEGRLR
ncbi:hypothetical protein QT881_16615, partial [Xanthomonas fragariae]|uniref:hypothetical protein n=1 Tax=Xanthomonas fragariae TaxID=48664 RepID=UPI0025A15BF1